MAWKCHQRFRTAGRGDDMTGAIIIPFVPPIPKEGAQRGTPEWARRIIQMERAWSREIDTNHRAYRTHFDELLKYHRIMKPVFVFAGAGYEGITTTEARQVIWDCLPDFGPAERELIIAVKEHDGVRIQWRSRREAARRRARRETNMDEPYPEWPIGEDFFAACGVLNIDSREARRYE